MYHYSNSAKSENGPKGTEPDSFVLIRQFDLTQNIKIEKQSRIRKSVKRKKKKRKERKRRDDKSREKKSRVEKRREEKRKGKT